MNLEPCPFCCAREAELHPLFTGFQVQCGQCRSSGPMNRSQIEAVQAWNRVSQMLAIYRGQQANELREQLMTYGPQLTVN